MQTYGGTGFLRSTFMSRSYSPAIMVTGDVCVVFMAGTEGIGGGRALQPLAFMEIRGDSAVETEHSSFLQQNGGKQWGLTG